MTGDPPTRYPQPGTLTRQTMMNITLPRPPRNRISVLGSRCATVRADLATTHLLLRLPISAPEKEEAWYLRNDMRVWNLNQIPNHINITRDIANCLMLCSNLQKTLDDRIWVFFSKGPNILVAHFLQAAPDQAALYHNVATRPVQFEPRFLYARFSWAIFSLLRPYLSRLTPRKVKVWVASEEEWQEKIIDGRQLRSHVRAS